MADYYRREAINSFITEQLCAKDKYSYKKYDELIERSLHMDFCAKHKIPYVEPKP